MPDTLQAGDKSQRFAPCVVARDGMRSLGSVIRPIVKALIVDRALSGRITPQEAERLIAQHGLRHE